MPPVPPHPLVEYEIRWKNYKRFADTDWLKIRPLTILIGPNNSGKSSIISPLLLLSQTMGSGDSDTPLVTHGDLIDVGNYTNFVHGHDSSREVFFGLRYHLHKQTTKKIAPVGAYIPGALELTFASGAKAQQTRLSRYEVSDIYNRPYIARSETSGSYNLTGAIDTASMNADEKRAVGRARPINFLFNPTRTLSSLEMPRDKAKKGKKRFSEPFSHYLAVVGAVYSGIFDLLVELSYVGPLRQRPKRFYRMAAESSKTVGTQGEDAPQIVKRMSPEALKRVDEWVRRFEFGDKLVCREIGGEFFELCFEGKGTCTNIADVGFGASQVVPLIIQAVSARPDSLTLAEQPEIHLNPRLQCILADLFVEMAQANHRVVVETHSEHLLVRLRTLIAAKKISPEKVAIYFVEKGESESKVRMVPVSNSGNIDRESWPEGFFDDALREALVLAKTQAEHRE